tara:strand:- start:264 stop:434 length:171 start_codon:yes stop_codon:yes gene_type:complete
MPANGMNQTPAGVNKTKQPKPSSNRRMVSRDTTIKTSLTIGKVPYKGNAVLNANRS